MGNHAARPAVITAIIVAALSLTACSTGSPGAADDPSATRSSSPSTAPSSEPARASVDFGTSPSGDGVPSCDDLLPASSVARIVPDARAVDEVSLAHVRGGVFAAQTAGGASCTVTNDVAELDEVLPTTHGDPAHQGAALQVLPDARAEYTDAQQPSSSSPDGAAVRCDASDSARVFCTGDALAGEAWVHLSLVRLQETQQDDPEQIQPRFQELLDHAASVVEASGVGRETVDHPDADGSPTQCDPANVNAVASEQMIDLTATGTDFASNLGQYAVNRLGGASCAFDVQTDSGYYRTDAVYSVVPDGGWVAEQRVAAGVVDRHDRLDLDGLGDGDGAWRTCDETACSVDVVRDGGEWTHWVLFTRAAPNTSSAIERWVTASLG